MSVNWTYCGDHVTKYTNVKSLCCVIYVTYTTILNKNLVKKKGIYYVPEKMTDSSHHLTIA